MIQSGTRQDAGAGDGPAAAAGSGGGYGGRPTLHPTTLCWLLTSFPRNRSTTTTATASTAATSRVRLLLTSACPCCCCRRTRRRNRCFCPSDFGGPHGPPCPRAPAGTSACPNGLFYCENKFFLPLRLNASMVDDGVCGEPPVPFFLPTCLAWLAGRGAVGLASLHHGLGCCCRADSLTRARPRRRRRACRLLRRHRRARGALRKQLLQQGHAGPDCAQGPGARLTDSWLCARRVTSWLCGR